MLNEWGEGPFLYGGEGPFLYGAALGASTPRVGDAGLGLTWRGRWPRPHNATALA